MFNIVLLGAPGSGKGTQAAKLIAEYKVAHISTGDILRAAVKNATDLGLEAKAYMDKGELVPDDLVISLVTERLQDSDTAAGFILDGFPRTSAQAVSLSHQLEEIGRPLTAAIAIDVPFAKIVQRLSSRRTCEQCGYIGSENDTACPTCGGTMLQRDDDKAEAITKRLEVYESSTAPLIDYYKGTNLLHSINGDQPADVVYESIKAIVC